METVKMLDLGGSTADAEFPEIHQEEGYLRAEFKDWQEKVMLQYKYVLQKSLLPSWLIISW